MTPRFLLFCFFIESFIAMDITNTDTDVTDDEDLVGAIQNREQSLDNDGSSEASGDYILTDDDTIPSDDSIDDDPKIMMPSIDREVSQCFAEAFEH